MLDIKSLRRDLAAVVTQLARRGLRFDPARFLELEQTRKQLQVQTQALQNARNALAKQIGKAKSQGSDCTALLQQANQLAQDLPRLEQELATVQQALDGLLAQLPNIPHSSVPDGSDAAANVEVRRIGTVPTPHFTPQDHVDLGARLGMDFAAAVKITGTRFVVLQGALARLHRALIQFMLDVHTTEHGYTECYVPYLVNTQSLFGTGQLPKFAEELFALKGETGYHLIPTAEVPVTNLVRDALLAQECLPLKYVAHTPCFRSEAGSYGKDTRGMIRQHQFEKVELVQIVTPEESYRALEELTSHAERILQKLALPYRVMALCSGDMGFSAAKTYDLEVWLPGQQAYREISSCSNFESFQARRLGARYKDTQGKKNEWVHTLNGSGLAVGRTLVAILENYQDGQGNIQIPDALIPYMRGETQLQAGVP